MMMQEYDFDIEHVADEQSVIADAFSRIVNANDLDKETIALSIRAKVKNQSKKEVEFTKSDAQYNILKSNFHNDILGHYGVDSTIAKLKEKGYTPANFPKLRQAILSFIHSCTFCQNQDRHRPRNLSHPFVIGSHNPLEKVSIYTIGPFEKDKFSNKYITAMTDCFS